MKKERKIERIYHPYWLWEDYINGMYDDNKNEDKILKSKQLLTQPSFFYKTMLDLLEKYKISVDCNLSNVSCNRKAWLGQASCNFLYKASEKQVRLAWSELNDIEKIKANIEAEKIIKIYEERYYRIHSRLGEKMLF